MEPTNNIFSQTTQTESQSQVNYFDVLVGEGKKFKTPDDLAKGKLEADRYIDQLVTEKRLLEEQLKERKGVEELLTEWRSTDSQPTNPKEPLSERQVEGPTSVKPEEITKLVEDKLTELEKRKKAESNLSVAQAKLKEVWGESAKTLLNDRAAELNVSLDYLKEQAASNPQVFFRLIGLDAKPSQPPVPGLPKATQTVHSFASSNNEKNYAYYEKMRRENSHLYYSSEIQKEKFEQAKKLGDNFYK